MTVTTPVIAQPPSSPRRLGSEGIECFRVLFPQGLDANSLITSVEDPAGALAELLRAAVWLGPAHASASRPAPAQDASQDLEPLAAAPTIKAPAPAAEPFVDIGDAGPVEIEAPSSRRLFFFSR